MNIKSWCSLLHLYEDGRLRAIDPSYGIQFTMEKDVASAVEVMEGDRVLFSGQRVQ